MLEESGRYYPRASLGDGKSPSSLENNHLRNALKSCENNIMLDFGETRLNPEMERKTLLCNDAMSILLNTKDK